jgi:hypothetical protein
VGGKGSNASQDGLGPLKTRSQSNLVVRWTAFGESNPARVRTRSFLENAQISVICSNT